MNTSADLPETALKRHADLLVQAGFSREEALRMSLHEEVVHATASAGAVYESITLEKIGGVWQRACRAGARSVLLEVRAVGPSPEEYDRHVTVTVLEHEPWPDLDTAPSRPLLEATRDRNATREERQGALGRITARRSELLRELAELNEMTAGHEEALARGIMPDHLLSRSEDDRPALRPNTVDSRLTECALLLAEARRAAELDGEVVEVWVVRSVPRNEGVGDLGLVWSRTHPHVPDARIYLQTGAAIWDDPDHSNALDWGWEAVERIEFKALCLLVQAIGLPFSGLNCEVYTQGTVMPELLRHEGTTPLDIEVFLNDYKGVHETYTDVNNVTTSVAREFERCKAVAPDVFGHLVMPEAFKRSAQSLPL